MKKYIQQCDLSGTMYGKGSSGKRKTNTSSNDAKRNMPLQRGYSKLYKDQFNEMSRFFHRDG